MALRGKVVLQAVGYTLVGLTFLGFALKVTLKVLDGKSLETYRSAKMIQWSYGAALVAIIALVLAAIVAAIMRVGRSMIESREVKRLAQTHGGSPIAEVGDTMPSPNKSLERTRDR